MLNVKGMNNLPFGVGGRPMCRLLSHFSNVTGQDVDASYSEWRLQGLLLLLKCKINLIYFNFKIKYF